ncbi:hypothetical protein PCYB_061780 [Plasmodium cynomolgi strain B]|uniref:Uncharacterized protein n=1 Tax=Plasmodium cynomolgi (strain B) TaxID=1120755 RepID=K6UCU2_PLACD|nr:hypothetical protein PCYB_061780 [Plasmodium cynomolgi strain B]GAB65446.1 hypothetical protein PCYB_061780 [Plasmodium cynomolgi strain B]
MDRQNQKRNFKILFERRIILSPDGEKHTDKSINGFYGVCLILLSLCMVCFSSFFFLSHASVRCILLHRECWLHPCVHYV